MNCDLFTVLIAGQNPTARAHLADHFLADGYEVLTAGSTLGAWQLLNTRPVHLVVVDTDGPDRGGREALGLVGQIRRSVETGDWVDPSLPVLLLAPRLAELERLRVFERGADDLLIQPVSLSEVRVRAAALMRRSHARPISTRVTLGPLEIDARAGQVWMQARPLALSHREYELLLVLAAEPTRVVTRAELLRRVWGFAPDDRTRTLDVHASRLRRKLAHPGERFVVNVWGRGYRLISPVSRQGSDGRQAPMSTGATDAGLALSAA